MDIIEGFGFEQCFEDENSLYYRAMIGFIKHNFFGHQYYTNSHNSTIMVFTFDKNKEYDNAQRTLCFEPVKTLKWKIHFMKKYKKYTGYSLQEVVAIMDSGQIVLDSELEYEFIKQFLLHLGFNIFTN